MLLGASASPARFRSFCLLASRRHRRRPLQPAQRRDRHADCLDAAGVRAGGAHPDRRRVQIWHVFVLAALLGVVNAFDIPARQAFLVDMVGREDLMNAIALNSSMFNGARIIGPAVAGILVAAIGEGWCFFANARRATSR